ncbi:16085_t:CDS:2 [Funneliformis geosporum]|uniref:General transcription and DNA repair factor IIH subunit TFB5 n=1 Tax=Funneliformis geosporum TaxID=1117311 RepID=A0A9W4WXZ3_9GLOM|nr:16085_t:CDS:2 [Funneliformis geosporum]CAI2171946.1 17876_t:CDS:2 [Funneliformis geosporum]
MVKALKGVILKCDSTVKQVINKLNERKQFIIEDLDDTHLFIDAKAVEEVKIEVEKLLEENTYKSDLPPPNEK